jgi:hypothetical protein
VAYIVIQTFFFITQMHKMYIQKTRRKNKAVGYLLPLGAVDGTAPSLPSSLLISFSAARRSIRRAAARAWWAAASSRLPHRLIGRILGFLERLEGLD